MSTKKFTANGIRQIKAFETVYEYGAGYLNSLIGTSPAETCKKIEELMPFIKQTVDGGVDGCPVMSFLSQSIWTAGQYEGVLNDGARCEVAE